MHAARLAPDSRVHRRFCNALTWFRVGRRELPVFPWLAAKYLVVFLLATAAVLALAELWLSHLSTERVVVSGDWVAENANINAMNQAKLADVTPQNPTWRSPGIPLIPPRGSKTRILVLGDSFVWGDGYANANDLWWRQLDRELKHRGYFDVEIVAAGLNGASTQEQLRWIQELHLLDQVQPDLVIVGYVTNDADMRDSSGQPYVKQVGRDVQPPQWDSLDRSAGRLLPTLVAQIKPKLTAKWAAELKGAYPYFDWELRLLKSPNIEAYARTLNDFAAAFKSRELPVFFVTLPNAPTQEYFLPRYAPVEPLFKAAGLPFHNLLDAFLLENRPSVAGESQILLRWGINPANAHPGPAATHFHARQIADILERDHRNLLGSHSPKPPPLKPNINDWMPPSVQVRQVSSNEWTLSLPPVSATYPRLPVGAPHVILAFELPVVIRGVELEGDNLRDARLWFTSIDTATGVEIGEQAAVRSHARHEDDFLWSLRELPQSAAVNTLKLTAEFDDRLPERRFTLDARNASRKQGSAYFVLMPELRDEADDFDHPERSQWLLLENGVKLEPSHTLHSQIETQGEGRWSHWSEAVIFSSSDNSNPRTNGRRYELVKYPFGGRNIRLRVAFDEAAVRP